MHRCNKANSEYSANIIIRKSIVHHSTKIYRSLKSVTKNRWLQKNQKFFTKMVDHWPCLWPLLVQVIAPLNLIAPYFMPQLPVIIVPLAVLLYSLCFILEKWKFYQDLKKIHEREIWVLLDFFASNNFWKSYPNKSNSRHNKFFQNFDLALKIRPENCHIVFCGNNSHWQQ